MSERFGRWFAFWRNSDGLCGAVRRRRLSRVDAVHAAESVWWLWLSVLCVCLLVVITIINSECGWLCSK